MAKTLICTNILDSISSEVYGNHCQMWYRLGRGTTDEFILFHPYRMTIDMARNTAAKIAMQNECDFIWFVDSDMILSPRTYESLKSRDADVCLAHTYIRGEPYHEMFFKFTKNNNGIKKLDYYKNWREEVDENGVLKADAVGFACALIKVKRLLEMTPPYFITGEGQTEDVYYCLKLLDHDSNASILVDTTVPTGHLLNPEVIGLHNVEELRSRVVNIDKNNQKMDRGQDYLESCKQIFNQKPV